MALMKGSGPFGERPAGRFNFQPPQPRWALYLEPSPKRIRVIVAGETIADSRRAMLLHESGHLPVYYLPPEDVREDVLAPSDHHTHCPKKGDASYYTVRAGERMLENAAWYYPQPIDHAPPGLAGLIAFTPGSVDRWLEEDEEMLGHPRDPYTRIDVLRSCRPVRIRHGQEVLAQAEESMVLFESGLEPRYYLRPEDVRAELLESDTHSICPYKGIASYHSVRLPDGDVLQDCVWHYPEPTPEASRVAGLMCFYTERELELELGD